MLYLLLLVLSACAPSSPADFRQAGDAWAKGFAADLRDIESRDDLERAIPRIKRHYNRLAELVGEVAEWERAHPGVKVPFEPTQGGDALFIELARVRELPGGKEILEDCEGESIRAILRFKG